jgi:hypothetical protein
VPITTELVNKEEIDSLNQKLINSGDKKNPFAIFPNDITMAILNYLNLKDLKHLGRVSKSLYVLSQSPELVTTQNNTNCFLVEEIIHKICNFN